MCVADKNNEQTRTEQKDSDLNDSDGNDLDPKHCLTSTNKADISNQRCERKENFPLSN